MNELLSEATRYSHIRPYPCMLGGGATWQVSSLIMLLKLKAALPRECSSRVLQQQMGQLGQAPR